MFARPATVTRFYGNTCFGLNVLKDQQVALVRVTLLNDPFDPYGFLEIDFGNYLDLLRYVRANHPHDLGWFRIHVTAQSWGKTERDLRRYMARERPHRDDAPKGQPIPVGVLWRRASRTCH
jgi:hypothetical protein